MAIIYSYPTNINIQPNDIVVGTSTIVVNGKAKNQTKSFPIVDLGTYINLSNTLDSVLTNGNTSLLDAKIGELYLYDTTELQYGKVRLYDSNFGFYDAFGVPTNLISREGISFFPNAFSASVSATTITASRTYQLPDASGIIALTSDISGTNDLQAVTDVGNTTTNDINVVGVGLQTIVGANFVTSSDLGFVEYAGFAYDGNVGRLLIGSNSFETAIKQTTISSGPFEFLLPNNKTPGAYTIATTADIASPLTTKGDLYTFSTVDARLPVGLNTQVLAADSSTATGLKWVTNTAVTSVGMTVPSAFSVTPSTITTSGTFAITGAGSASQYVRGDGTLANFPTSTGGGASVSYYLNGSVSQGTIGGVAYKEMNGTPIFGAGTDFTINADGYIAQFITDVGDPNKLLIPAGNWNFETYFSASSSGGSPKFYIELYKYDGATFTLITSNSATPENITGGTSIDLYFTAIAVPATTLLATDRLAVRFYVIHSGRTITMHTENSHLSQIITTFSTGLTTLNGLTSQAQYFAVGTTGTDFNISSITDTHTFNLPTASATNRGALSTTDWSTFNNKANANTELNIRRTGYTVYNEFLSSASNGSYAQATVLAGTITSATGNVDENHFGVVTFNSSVTANSGFYSALNPSATVGISCTLVTDLQTDLVFKTPVTISPTTTIRFGVANGSITSAEFTNGFYFEIVGNSLVGKTANASVRSSSSAYTISADTWYHLRVIATSTTLITYYVYDMSGSLLFSTTLNTNLPTTIVVMSNSVIATNSGTAVTILGYFDLISITFPPMVRGALD
jgi:hypothetical protein